MITQKEIDFLNQNTMKSIYKNIGLFVLSICLSFQIGKSQPQDCCQYLNDIGVMDFGVNQISNYTYEFSYPTTSFLDEEIPSLVMNTQSGQMVLELLDYFPGLNNICNGIPFNGNIIPIQDNDGVSSIDGCEPFVTPPNLINGQIAVAEYEGGCSYEVVAANAQNANAIGVIIYTGYPVLTNIDWSGISIPVIIISKQDYLNQTISTSNASIEYPVSDTGVSPCDCFKKIFKKDWIFSDGTIATGANVTHTFPSSSNCTQDEIYDITFELIQVGLNHRFDTCRITKQIIIPATGLNIDYQIIATPNGCGQFDFGYTKSNNSIPNISSPQWTFGDGYLGNGATTNHTYNANGTYTVILTDGGNLNSCPIVTTVTINDLPTTNFSSGNSCSLNETFTISGYTNSGSYYWDFDGTIVSATGGTQTHTFSSSGLKLVKLTYTNNNGCSTTISKYISIGGVDAVFQVDQLMCEGEFINVSNVSSSGSTYLWEIRPSGTSTWTTIGTGLYPIHAVNQAGIYELRLTVQDNVCPGASHTETITVEPIPVANFTHIIDACNSIVNLSFGNSSFPYIINYGDGTIDNGSSLPSALNHTYTSTGVYTIQLELTNAAGCSDYFSQNIVIPSEPSISIYSPTDKLCANSQLNLQVVINNAPPSSPTINWKKDGTNYATTNSISITQGGTYQVDVDFGGGCTRTESITIVEFPEITATITPSSGASCIGINDGSVLITGLPNVPYTINNGSPLTGSVQTVSNLSPGLHYIKVAYNDLPSCYTILTVNIQDNSPQLTGSATASDCNANTGTASVSVTNGAPSFSYRWWNVLTPNTIIGTNSNQIFNVAPGKYTVEVTDANNCIVTLDIEVPEIIVNLVLDNAPVATCTSGQIPVFISANYNINTPPSGTYTWYQKNTGTWIAMGGASSNTRTLPPGDYKVEYIDTKGCGDDLEFTVGEYDDLTVTLQIDQPNCSNGSGSIKAIVNGGSGNYNFNWSNSSSNTSQIFNISSGNFSLTVTDVPGCSVAATGTVAPLSPNTLAYSFHNISGCDLNVGITGGVGPYHYEWFIDKEFVEYTYVIHPLTGDTLQAVATNVTNAWHWVHSHNGGASTTTSAAGFESGDYQLHVTDAYGCQLIHELELVFPEATIPDFSFVWSRVDLPVEPSKVVDPIIRENMAEASNDMFNAMDDCVLAQKAELTTSIENNCLSLDSIQDRFILSYEENLHHFTLYYYDVANNLVKTVPPQGVELLTDSEIQDVLDYRADGTSGNPDTTKHRMETKYKYNSLGQLIQQYTPDGGFTNFLYNDINQLRFSQNAQQAIDGTYSYTKYDELGRIVEVGKSNLTLSSYADLAVDPDGAGNPLLAPTIDVGYPTTGNSEITHTVYTSPALIDYYGEPQRYLQNRVSYVWSDEDGDLATTIDQFYTAYSYDAHGNVKQIIQEDPVMGRSYLEYVYDLISGNVLEVKYNKLHKDKFFHRYRYDSQNRIVEVKTSKDGVIWDSDARYDYYLHGPLSRTEIGEDGVQGQDFQYTIHGWLKAINTPHLSTTDDFSQDGHYGGAANPSITDIPQDRFGMTLGYYEGDFKRTNSFLDDTNPLYENTNSNAHDLYNGNISHWTNSQIKENTNIFGNIEVEPSRAGVYQYDVLNRIVKNENAFATTAGSIASWGANTNNYETTYEYGANGNITKLNRRQGTGTLMDELEYEYDNDLGNVPINNNQLTKVKDQSNFTEDGRGDLEKTHEYEYDAIGNLTKDEGKERLDLDNGQGFKLYDVTLNISWNVYGKVKSVEKVITGNGVNRTDFIDFLYTTNGDRRSKVFKEDKNNDGSLDETEITSTYYVRDASSNIMAIYERKNELVAGTQYNAIFTLIEQPLYGSDRIGVSNRKVVIAEVLYNAGDEIALDLSPDGIIERSEYQNWITSSNRSILNNSICEGRITTIDFDAANNNQYGSDSDLAQFIGVAGNGVAVAENLDGELQFYVVLAENYLGVQDACLAFDKNGMLMKGTDLIVGAYPKAKPIIIQHPTTEVYTIVTLNAAGKPEYHSVDMAATGYGTFASPLGEVITNNQTIDAQVGVNYGWHFAGYEDHINGQSIIYHSRYQEDLIDPQQGTTDILAYVFGGAPNAPPQLQVVHSINGYGSTEQGELQISKDGDELSWYQHDLNVSAFAHRTFKLHLLPLAADHISLLGSPLVFNGSPSGNYGEGNLEFTDDNLLYSQRGVYLENGSDKNIFKLDRLTGNLLTTNTNATDYLYHEIKRGADGKFYIPRKNDPATQILTFDGSVGNENLFVDPDVWELSSSLPTQVYKIDLLPSPDTGYVRSISERQYELKDHLGNVRVLVGDIKLGNLANSGELDNLEANVNTTSEYYPFGMEMKRMVFTQGKFRFGFQGEEKDDEIKGSGNSLSYKFRINDTRIGRFLSIDPLYSDFPWNSSYAFSENRVIDGVELEGSETLHYSLKWDTGGNPQLKLTKTITGNDLIEGSMVSVVINGHYVADKWTMDGANEMAEHYGKFSQREWESKVGFDKKDRAERKKKSQEDWEQIWIDGATLGLAKGKVNPLKSPVSIYKKNSNVKKQTEVKIITNNGRKGKQARLRELAKDDKVSSADRGWIKSEINQMKRGDRTSIRNPPGKEMAHERGREAAKGYSYKHSNLQDKDLHKLQHKYDKNGTLNKERPIKKD